MADILQSISTAIDRIVGAVSPEAAFRRGSFRRANAYYDAATPNKQRPGLRTPFGDVSANAVVDKGAAIMRAQMRNSDRNHDLVTGALNVLVANTIGSAGIGVEFQPRRRDGTIHTEYAKLLQYWWGEFCKRPEVTGVHTMAQVQRLVARSKYRDGEVFAQRVRGIVPGLEHGSRVPYSIECLEADLVPLEYNDLGLGIRQGFQVNTWGRPTGVYVYKTHPGEWARIPVMSEMKRIPMTSMIHVAHRDRLHMLRGVTPFASVITRMDDIKDYEESERVAAKIAARLTAYVKRHSPADVGYEGPSLDEKGNPVPRDLRLQAGTIIDTLAVGEEIGMIDTNRPNPNLIGWRNGQLRAFAAGISASYSTLAKAYDGTYSAQRQEMVESYMGYAILADDFSGQFMAPVVEDFCDMTALSVAPVPADVDRDTLYDVLYVAPSMPWIDPAKEALGWLALVKAGFAAEVEVIRKRGRNPDDVAEQIRDWRKKTADLHFESNTAAAFSAAGMQDGAPQQSTPLA